MKTEEHAQQLHDKATRGIVLSASEQVQLESWYSQHDQEESGIIAGTVSPRTLVALQAQVDATVAQLLPVSQRIQELVAHNAALRREISALQHQLSQGPTVQPA